MNEEERSVYCWSLFEGPKGLYNCIDICVCVCM